MKKLVIDIETVGIPWEEHDPYVREYLIKGQSDEGAEETRRAGGLSPFPYSYDPASPRFVLPADIGAGS